MSVLKTLQQRIAPELNFLFTNPPTETPAGLESGWNGHEHAWHTFFVARMFGSRASLCSGDFAVLSRLLPPLTSLEREARHAWCTIGELAPVDLSMTFVHFGQAPQLRTAVTGEGINGDWQIHYAEDESILDGNLESGNEIIFIEREVFAEPAELLLEDASHFLPAVVRDGREDWSARHGADIHAKISLHCHRYAAGQGKSIRQRASREDAVAWIARTYADPQPQILKLLRV